MTTVLVNREELLDSLEKAKPCLAGTDTRIPEFKCFFFHDGTVSAFDGQDGIVTASIPFPESFGVAGKELLTIVKKLDMEEIEIELSEQSVTIKAGKSKVVLARIAANNRPDFVPKNPTELAVIDNLILAMDRASTCLDNRSIRFNVPPCLMFSGYNCYATTSAQGIRVQMSGNALRPFALGAKSVKSIIGLGQPTYLFESGGVIGAAYEEDRTFYVTREVQATTLPQIVRSLDSVFLAPDTVAPGVYCLQDGVGERLYEAVKRLQSVAKIYGGEDALSVSADADGLILDYQYPQCQATEAVAINGINPTLKFTISLNMLVEALALSPEYIDLRSPKALGFFTVGAFQHSIAMQF